MAQTVLVINDEPTKRRDGCMPVLTADGEIRTLEAMEVGMIRTAIQKYRGCSSAGYWPVNLVPQGRQVWPLGILVSDLNFSSEIFALFVPACRGLLYFGGRA